MLKKLRKGTAKLFNDTIDFFYTKDETDLVPMSKADYIEKVIEGIPQGQIEKAYEKAWQAKNFEIDNYWKRGNYFWAFQVASFAGYFTVLGSDAYTSNPEVLYAIICIGIVTSFAWTLTNKGSKTWQRHWEIHVDLLEEKVTGPLYKIVTTDRTYSVSKLNDIVSRFFIVIWIVLGITFFRDNISFEWKRIEIDYAVILCTLATFLFLLAMFKGHGRGRFGRRKIKLYEREYEVIEPTEEK